MSIRIGALTTHADLAASTELARRRAGAGRGGRGRRRPGGQESRHDRRQHRARGSGLRSAHRPGGPGGPHDRCRCPGGANHRRRPVLHRHHDDGAGRRRDSRGDRRAGRGPRAGVGVREVRAPRVALRRGWRRGAGDDRERHVLRGARGAWRPAAERPARAGGRARADRQAVQRRDDRRGGAAGGRRPRRRRQRAISSRPPSTARRWRRSTSSGPSRRPSRARSPAREPAAPGQAGGSGQRRRAAGGDGRPALRRRALARRVDLSGAAAQTADFPRGRAGSRQDRGRQGAGGHARCGADPAAVLRRPRHQSRGLRVELSRGRFSKSACSKAVMRSTPATPSASCSPSAS